jgi:hypothetical protein
MNLSIARFAALCQRDGVYDRDTKRRELEHQFEVTNSELREEYLAAVLEIHDSPEAKMTRVTH